MFESVLKEIREKVRTRKYVMTLHAEDEMNDDELTISMSDTVCLQVKSRKDKKTEIPKNGNMLFPVKHSGAMKLLL